MRRSVNYYSGLTADYSRPGLVSTEVADGLIDSAQTWIGMMQEGLPSIDSNYSMEDIERENREWWPSHCEAYVGEEVICVGQNIAKILSTFVRMVRSAA